MKLYLVRHGNAVDGSNDMIRPLSKEGIAEVRKVADFLKDHGCQVDTIYHSVRLRAKQTAEILHERLKVKKLLVERSGLSPNDAVTDVADFVERHKEDIMLVGHMPFMGKLVSLLVDKESGRDLVIFRTGGVVVLEKKHGESWRIGAVIDPDIL